MNCMIGFLNIYKPSGISSQKVVSEIKKRLNISKVGHMGTLDPLACGVLPIAVGKATRMFDYFLDKTKTYIALFTFGKTTTTLDSEGEVTETCDYIPTEKDINEVLGKFLGEIEQMPPAYSAKKVNGICAYRLARNNVEFTLKPKKVLIKEFRCLGQESADTFKFEIACGSGTYIRSLARDLATKLKSKAYMSFLERTESGVFKKENAIKFEDIGDIDLLNFLVPIEDVFEKMPRLTVDEGVAKRLIDGQMINMDGLDGNYLIFCDGLECVGEIKDKKLKIKTYLKG